MNIQHVLIIGIRDDLRATLEAAARRAFPEAKRLALADVPEAQSASPAGETAMLLIEPSATALKEARASLDAAGLPRWPVLALAATAQEAEEDVLLADEWEIPQIARALEAAVEKHALRRELARLKGDLLTVARRVNHDLRSSLNGVMTASEVIKEIFSAEKPEDVELIQPVADSAAEIARLIDQVSFVTKATAAPAAPQKLAMDELVWKGLSRVEARIHEKDAQVTHAENWPVVSGVASWIETIWTNLISNALEHGGPKPRVNLGWHDQDDERRFWVDDDGPGVAPEKRSALFTPFHRLAEAGAARGFGLSVTQRLVELSGGRTGYEPRAQGGSRFYFTLPKVR